MKKTHFTQRLRIWLPSLLFLSAGAYIYFAHPFEKPVDFNTEIRPILNTQCMSCHGGVKRSGGFSLLFRSEALAETESGKPAIIPGDPGSSEFIKRLTHHDPEERMPLDAPPLSEDEITKLTKWIRQGAEWEDHWAYVKPKNISLPPVQTSNWTRNGIDHFVLSRLEKEGLKPSPEADKATLLRRVSLDLIGLPPTPQQMDAFIKDTSANAYEKVVDSLLASPHYGERWAAPWMDLARYADTKGYERDPHRDIWRYRDYVIQSFNDNKPFDQFTIEQLAGDLLPNPTDEQRIATAYHRNTMNNDEGGTDNEEFRTAAILDRVSNTWEVWQGTTMACVQCHSHPYDPFRHEEFYQSLAFFNNTRDADTPDESPNLHTYTAEDSTHIVALKQWVKKHAPDNQRAAQVKQVSLLLKTTEPKVHPYDCDTIVKGALLDSKYLGADHGGYARINQLDLTNKTQLLIRYAAGQAGGRIELRKDKLDGELIGTVRLEKTDWMETKSIPLQPANGSHDVYLRFYDPNAKSFICSVEWMVFTQGLPGASQPGFANVQNELVELLNTEDVTPVMVENPKGFRRKTHLFERGNWLTKGKEVQPGVPKSLPTMPKNAPRNRLGLSQWLVSPENPLTARVTVNRFWEQFFGTGIVETAEDFGTQGSKPSHPELLDWLANQFVHEYQWRTKKIHKLMVMSATYRQSSRFTPELREKDPANHLLARGPRFRLTAEQIRDQALAVSGLLSEKMYGPSVMPPQPLGIWQVPYSDKNWVTSEGEDAFRRGIYTYWRRTTPYPSMVTFDGMSREICTSRRIRTNTPLQALVTLNDTVYLSAAQALARRMVREGGKTLDEQLQYGYRLALGHAPKPATLAVLRDLYAKAEQPDEQKPDGKMAVIGVSQTNSSIPSLTVVANTIMNLDEFMTKE